MSNPIDHYSLFYMPSVSSPKKTDDGNTRLEATSAFRVRAIYSTTEGARAGASGVVVGVGVCACVCVRVCVCVFFSPWTSRTPRWSCPNSTSVPARTPSFSTRSTRRSSPCTCPNGNRVSSPSSTALFLTGCCCCRCRARCLQQKPRAVSLLDVYKDSELLTTVSLIGSYIPAPCAPREA